MTQPSLWRERLWPVYGKEHRKVLPLLALKLLVALNFTLLYSVKKTLTVIDSGSGAELISVIKGSAVTPLAFLFTLIYAKLSNHLKPDRLFYATLTPFLVFFALFILVLHPYRDVFTPTTSADALQSWLGPERVHWVSLYRYWMNALFFAFAELWGAIVINMLFWNFANHLCSLNEARRFYTLFSASGDLGMVIATLMGLHSAQLSGSQGFHGTVYYVMGYFFLCNALIIMLYYWSSRSIVALPDEQALDAVREDHGGGPVTPSPRKKSSLIGSLKIILRSPALYYLSAMTIGYSLSFNLIESFWDANVKLAFPLGQDHYRFTNGLTFYTGIVSMVVTLLAAGSVIRTFGWHSSAQITPAFITCSALILFTLYYQYETLQAWGISPLWMIVYMGLIQNVITKTCKYAFFDPTKEMAYIPLNEEIKVKGKAAVDVVASRLGKSGSSWLQVGLLEWVGKSSVLSIGHYLVPLILLTTSWWSYAVYRLNRQFDDQRYSK